MSDDTVYQASSDIFQNATGHPSGVPTARRAHLPKSQFPISGTSQALSERRGRPGQLPSDDRCGDSKAHCSAGRGASLCAETLPPRSPSVREAKAGIAKLQ